MLPLSALVSVGCPAPAPIEIVVQPSLCPSAVLSNTVSLWETFAQRSGVAEVRYDADLNADVMNLSLFDTSGTLLGTATDAQLFGAAAQEANARVGSRQLKSDGPTLTSFGVQDRNNRHAITWVVTDDETDDVLVRIEAAFRNNLCQTEVAATRPLPCAANLAVEEAVALLPSCGLDFDARIARGEILELETFTYLLPEEAVSDSAQIDRRLTRDGEVFVPFTLVANAIGDSAFADIFARTESLFADARVRRLFALAGDTTWTRVLAQHVGACLESGFDDEGSANVSAASSALNSGSNGNRSPESFSPSSGGRRGSSHGDPHLVTFDNRRYDFQAAGEFLAAERTGPAPFAVHARFEALPSSSGDPICQKVTWATAAVAVVGDTRVQAQVRNDDWVVYVDGTEYAAATPPTLPAGTTLDVVTNKVTLTLADATTISFRRAGRTLGLEIALPESTEPDPHVYRGLFGDADGDPENDLVGTAGVLTSSTVDVLREELRPQWQLDATTSAFTYFAPVTGPDDYNDPARPSDDVSVNDLPPEAVSVIGPQCRRLAATDAAFIDCVLDQFCAERSLEADTGENEGAPALTDRNGITFSGALVEVAVGETLNLGETADPTTCGAPAPFVAQFVREGTGTLTADIDGVSAADGTPVTLPAGTNVQSMFVFLPPHPESVGSVESASVRVAGSLNFPAPILAVLTDGDVLAQTHTTFLGAGRAVDGALVGVDDAELSTSPAQLEFSFSLEDSLRAKGFRVLIDGGR